jgi:hypothetical protein
MMRCEMVSIASMLKPSKESAVDHLEELAARLAAGEDVAPEEVTVILDRLRKNEEELQLAVDRHTRVADLHRQIADADKVAKRLQVIDSAYADAEAAATKARAAYNALIAKHHEEHLTCRHRLEAIGHAKRALVAEENLPPSQAARLRVARQATAELGDLRDAAAHELRIQQGRLRQAEDELPQAEESAKLHPANESLVAEAERLRNAVAARRGLVADAERSIADAEARHDAALAKLASLEREVVQAALR